MMGFVPKKIALLVSFSGKGGVERMMLNLAQGISARGHAVDLLSIKSRALGPGDVPSGVRRLDIGTNHTLTSLLPLVRYLKHQRPDALLSAKDRANGIAVLARKLAGVPTRVVVRMGTTVSASLTDAHFLKRWFYYRRMRWTYPFADGVVAVSQGVAYDMARIIGIDSNRFTVIANPVISSRMFRLAEDTVDHPWLNNRSEPVIIGIGRLTRQKDFATLIRAFARVQDTIPCRLIILGEGRDRGNLDQLATQLGVDQRIDMPGFLANPYAYLKKADVFVLSSRWEGSPNVLTEAMALGVPVVSTDCPSGPREVLKDGRVAPLVPMQDPAALSSAIKRVLTQPPDATMLAAEVKPFTIEESSRKYASLLLGPRYG